MIRFTILGELPDMNTIVKLAKGHFGAYSNAKRKYTQIVGYSALKHPRIDKQVDVVITWYCKNQKKDKDNIMAGQKFIFDGLIEAGVLKNDGWKEIGSITHKFTIDKNNPRIEVELQEVA